MPSIPGFAFSRRFPKALLPALGLPLLAALAACGAQADRGGSNGLFPKLATPTVAVTPAATSLTTAQSLAVAVTVSGTGAGVPTGTVTLTSGAFNSGAVALANGAASIAVPAGVLPAGADALSVTYAPPATAITYLKASGAATVTVTDATPSVVTASSTPVAVSGHPFQALPIGSNVLVSVTGDSSDVPTGVAVYTASSPSQLTYKCTQAAPPGAMAALGLTPLPNGMGLALAVGDAGFDLINVAALVANCGSGQTLVSQGQATSTNPGPGTFAIAVTPDGKYAFVANEFGANPGSSIQGNVAVVGLNYDTSGRLIGTTAKGQFSTGGQAIANVTLSPDGTRLYVTSELARPGVGISATGNPILAHGGCLQGAKSTPQTHGLLTVVDVAKAEISADASAIIATVASGCSPVRVVETSDQQVIWVAARGDNRVLAFSTHMLESNPDAALLGYGDTGGVAPVGLQLFRNQQFLAVANSNRFSNPNGGAPTENGTLTILTATPVKPVVVQKVGASLFPRNVAVAADDSTLYLTDYSSFVQDLGSPIFQVITTSLK